jgi:hypothetical protein
MIHRKASLFAPTSLVTKEILSPKGPGPHSRKVRELGRKVPNFDDKVWVQERYATVVDGNYLKFTQNAELRQQLLATGKREMVEASPQDRIWGRRVW